MSSSTWRPRWPRGALAAAALAGLLLAVPYLGFLGSHQLWQPHEPDLVETAREMRASGDLLVPRLNGEVYAEKPPLYYWSALAAASLRGRLDETAARLPAALAALGLILVTAAFGARAFGPRAGLLAGLAVGTTPLVVHYGTAGTTDMLLAFTTAGAFAALHRACCEERACGRWLVVAGACVGAAVLAKSLVGPALLAVGFVPALFLQRERRWPHAGWWGLAGLVALAIVAPWYGLVGLREGWSFLYENLIRQTLGRFFTDDEKRGAFYTYLGTMPLDLLPWTVFAPAAFLHARRVRREDPARWERLRFLLVFVAADILFLSLSRCRIHKYVLPLFPLLAVVLGATLDGAESAGERRCVKWAGVGLASVLAGLAVAVPVFVRREWPPLVGVVALVGIVLLAGAVVVGLVARGGSGRRVGLAIALVGVVWVSFVEKALVPRIDEIRSDRALEEAIRAQVPVGEPLAGYRFGVRSYLIFYTERTYRLMDHREELDRYIRAAGPRAAFFLTREKHFVALAAEPGLGARLSVVGKNPAGVGHDDFVLVRVAPPG